MKTYFLYVRKYSIFTNDYILKVYKVITDNIYKIIGKIYCTSMEKIERIDYNKYTEERENFWKETGHTIENYIEPILKEDKE